MILDALYRRRKTLLADRWHPLWVYPYADGPIVGQVGQVIVGAISEQIPYFYYGGPLPKDDWEAVIDAVRRRLDEVHADPHLGEPLSEIIELKYAADNRYSLEVSIQRAAKRLEQKSLIERRYVTRVCESERKRSIVCVRTTPTREEMSDAIELRTEAKQIHLRHTLQAVEWIRKRGQDIETRGERRGEFVGYHRAATDWLADEQKTRDDWKWLSWFDNL